MTRKGVPELTKIKKGDRVSKRQGLPCYSSHPLLLKTGGTRPEDKFVDFYSSSKCDPVYWRRPYEDTGTTRFSLR